jgi:hypothetical protein
MRFLVNLGGRGGTCGFVWIQTAARGARGARRERTSENLWVRGNASAVKVVPRYARHCESAGAAGTDTSGLSIQFGNGLREDLRNLVIKSRIMERHLYKLSSRLPSRSSQLMRYHSCGICEAHCQMSPRSACSAGMGGCPLC